MSVSAKTPHLPATWCSRMPSYPWLHSSSAGMRSFALILSMTAPVPPAHLSFMEGSFFFRSLPGTSLKTMIFASWPPSSMTEFVSGWSFSTASETAVTSCTNFAPIRLPMAAPPEPVTKARKASGGRPSSRSIRSRNSRTISACFVSCRR